MATEGPVPVASPEHFQRSRGFTPAGDRYSPGSSGSSGVARDVSSPQPAGTYVDWAPLRSSPTPVKSAQRLRLHPPGSDAELSRSFVAAEAGDFASPAASAYAESFQDCVSEANSVSSLDADDGSCDGGDPSRANSTREGEGTSNASDDSSFASDWYTRYLEELRLRGQKEAELAALREAHEKQQAQCTALQIQVALQQATQEAASSGSPPPVELPQTVVAREVAGMLGRAIGADCAAREVQGEIAMLHQRIERLSGMEAALERKREREKERHSTQMRWFGHAALAVGCVGAGALGVYLAVNRPWATGRSSPATSPTPPQADAPSTPLPQSLAASLRVATAPLRNGATNATGGGPSARPGLSLACDTTTVGVLKSVVGLADAVAAGLNAASQGGGVGVGEAPPPISSGACPSFVTPVTQGVGGLSGGPASPAGATPATNVGGLSQAGAVAGRLGPAGGANPNLTAGGSPQQMWHGSGHAQSSGAGLAAAVKSSVTSVVHGTVGPQAAHS